MTTQEIAIGTSVRSHDGKDVGKIKRLIIDADTNALAYLVVDDSFFTADHLVEPSMVAAADDRGVTLSITEAEAKQLPEYVEREVVQTRGGIEVPTRVWLPIPIAGRDGNWRVVDSGRAAFPSVSGPSIFMQPPIGTVVTQSVSSIADSDVAISTGTDVTGSDGDKIGKVDELLLDDDNRIIGFVVQAGFLFTHDVRIPIDWVEGIAHDQIRLNVTKDQAEQSRHG